MFRRFQNPIMQGTAIMPNVMQSTPIVRVRGVESGSPQAIALLQRYAPIVQGFVRSQRQNQEIGGLQHARVTRAFRDGTLIYDRLFGRELIEVILQPEIVREPPQEQTEPPSDPDHAVFITFVLFGQDDTPRVVLNGRPLIPAASSNNISSFSLTTVYIGDDAHRYVDTREDVRVGTPEIILMAPQIPVPSLLDVAAANPIPANGFTFEPFPGEVVRSSIVVPSMSEDYRSTVAYVGEATARGLRTNPNNVCTFTFGASPSYVQFARVIIQCFSHQRQTLTIPTPKSLSLVPPRLVQATRYLSTQALFVYWPYGVQQHDLSVSFAVTPDGVRLAGTQGNTSSVADDQIYWSFPDPWGYWREYA